MSATTFRPEVQTPLVPADVAFPSFQFFQIDVKDITDGDLSFLSGEGFKGALTLMAKSWHETPAASLPDDDRKLAAYCGLGRDRAALTAFAAVKEEALSDFALCSDGRYYSRTLAPKALDAWESRKAQIAKTSKARQVRAENRQGALKSPPSARTSVTELVTTSDTGSRRDQIKGDETRSEDRRSEEKGPSGNDGRAGKDDWKGRRRQIASRQAPVPEITEDEDLPF